MLLTCDIGNTNIKCGLFSDNVLIEFLIISSADEFNSFISSKGIKNIAVSSVVPGKIEWLKEIIVPGINITLIDVNLFFNLVINYSTPETLGIDRLCGCEGAFYLFKKSEHSKLYDSRTLLITVDLGTATTINFIRYPGIFEGGLIAPGIKMMSKALHSGTAQLPIADTARYTSVTGKNTMQSIAGGIICSTVGMIERAIRLSEIELETEKRIIYITGGNAELILPHLDFNYIYEKALVMYGINSVYNLNKN